MNDPTTATESGIESREETFGVTPSGDARYWISEIEIAEKAHKPWRDKSNEIINRYRGKKKGQDSKMNILFANVQTLQSTMFQKVPDPVVERRFRQKSPIARTIAIVMERAVRYSVDESRADEVFRSVRDDYLLTSRATCKVIYRADVSGDDTSDPEAVPSIDFQECRLSPVPWSDFLVNPEGIWTQKRWVAFRTRYNKRGLIERFGEETADKVIAKSTEKNRESSNSVESVMFREAVVWELWDKTDRKVVWVCPDCNEFLLDERDDPYGLKDFFPCPKPIQLIEVSSDSTPVVEYSLYEDQAAEVNRLTRRIYSLSDKIRAVGLFAGSQGEALRNMFQQEDGTIIPIEDFFALQERGGLSGVLEWAPIMEMVQTLNQLYIARESAKGDLYEISGMSDIIRGQGKERETAAAQRIKGQFATLRIDERKRQFGQLIAESYGIMGEMIAEHFEPEFLAAISDYEMPITKEEAEAGAAQKMRQMRQAAQVAQQQGQQPPPMQQVEPELSWEEVTEALRSDFKRSYMVRIETEDTVEVDRQAEKQQRIEFVTAFVQLLQAMTAAVQGGLPWPIAKEIIMFTVRGFSKARTLEEVLEDFEPNQQAGQQEDGGEAMKMAVEQLKAQVTQMQIAAEAQEAARDRTHESRENAADRSLERELQGDQLETQIETAEIGARARPAPATT
ncbi:MAG: hypothetical protein AB8B85_10700 [Paracoccaceae bacterium]